MDSTPNPARERRVPTGRPTVADRPSDDRDAAVAGGATADAEPETGRTAFGNRFPAGGPPRAPTAAGTASLWAGS